MMSDDDQIDSDPMRLQLRLSLIRRRIDQQYVLANTVVLSAAEASDSRDFAERVLVTAAAFETWSGEDVVLWHRRDGSAGWAMQLACPHASISLACSDIEDLSDTFPSTSGPCIACPAHMYVFDLGSGHCLTDRLTPRGRVYDVRTSTHTSADGRVTRGLWVARTPKPDIADCKPDIAVGNAIQLKLVEKGLRRRFGDAGLDD